VAFDQNEFIRGILRGSTGPAGTADGQDEAGYWTTYELPGYQCRIRAYFEDASRKTLRSASILPYSGHESIEIPAGGQVVAALRHHAGGAGQARVPVRGNGRRPRWNRPLWFLSLLAFVMVMIMLAMGYRAETGPFVILGFVSLALFFMGTRPLSGFAFTVWVFASVAVSMFYPAAFGSWFGYDLGGAITPLIQIIMFGMGTTLSLADFRRVAAMPWPILIGMMLQFTVMPFTGLAIALLVGFEPEIAAGIVLIGACPGGVASNLMAYLAGGDVALSVTMTSCSTLLSPVMTPFMMSSLAGRFIEVGFMDMMLSIINMIIVPVVAGIAANRLLYNPPAWTASARSLAAISLGSLGMAAAAVLSGSLLGTLQSGIVIGFVLIVLVTAAKLVIEHGLGRAGNWMDRVLPVVSMTGIIIIISVITSRSTEQLLTVGLAIIVAAMAHNAIGYTLGYWGGRLARLSEKQCRTVAFEVGMQNGGMASGLALNVLQSASAAIAPAIFGPWMNVSGSVLASWWHRTPLPAEAPKVRPVRLEEA
jgi:BASS family bile acid:Na+ symporter